MPRNTHGNRHGHLDSLSMHALLELQARNERSLQAAHAASSVAVHGFFRGKSGIREMLAELNAESDAIDAALKAAGAYDLCA